MFTFNEYCQVQVFLEQLRINTPTEYKKALPGQLPFIIPGLAKKAFIHADKFDEYPDYLHIEDGDRAISFLYMYVRTPPAVQIDFDWVAGKQPEPAPGEGSFMVGRELQKGTLRLANQFHNFLTMLSEYGIGISISPVRGFKGTMVGKGEFRREVDPARRASLYKMVIKKAGYEQVDGIYYPQPLAQEIRDDRLRA